MTIVVRTVGEPTAIAPALRAVVRELDHDQPLARVAPLDELIDNQTAARRFNTWLLGGFGAAAMTLTAIGLYSVLAYVVALRRHEMAVRLAIGGTPGQLVGLIVRHVSGVVGVGLSLGLAGALTAARSMRGLLFGIEPWDPLSQTLAIRSTMRDQDRSKQRVDRFRVRADEPPRPAGQRHPAAHPWRAAYRRAVR
jgi:hypothetical protein